MFMLGALVFQFRTGLITKPRFWAILPVLAAGCWYSLGAASAGVGVATSLLIAFLSFSTGCLRFLGKISYSLYLVHGPVGLPIINFGTRTGGSVEANLLVFGAALAASIVVAWLLWRFVEKPAQAWSSAIKYRHSGADGVASTNREAEQ
jgi:peptidoglycan/LPS O-acetylase OafA/YrhL